MKTINARVLTVLLTGVLLSNTIFAGEIDPHQLSYECEAVASQLNQLAHAKPNDACSGDVEVAAAYIDVAGKKMRNGNYKLAITAIGYGEKELKAISVYRSYCTNFSVSVKPYLAHVITLASFIEELGQ